VLNLTSTTFIHLIVALEEHCGDVRCHTVAVRTAGNHICSSELGIDDRGANCYVHKSNTTRVIQTILVLGIACYELYIVWVIPRNRKKIVSTSDVIFRTLDLLFDVK
jgi:hypothetical protein